MAISLRTWRACQAPVVNGWIVCRFHRARGGATNGRRNGMYRLGDCTQQAATLNRRLSDLHRDSRALLRRLVR